MTRRVRLGMLTPSSNTALEPITSAMLAGVPEVSTHFARFKVTEIALERSALAQFDTAELVGAAHLLAHARPDVIAWNGTSSGWLGFAADEALCRDIAASTGIQATTSMLALNELLTMHGIRRFGLVTPYTEDVQDRIVWNYAELGFACTTAVRLGLRDNFSFAEVEPSRLRTAAHEVAKSRPDAILVICTNLHAAPLTNQLEAELGLPVFDTIATAVWKSLILAGVDPRRVRGWGRLFLGPEG